MPEQEHSRILVVDDDAAMREMLTVGLTTEHIEVESAADAAQALERVDSGEIDVVVTDLRMPQVSGLELCAAIVRQSPALPVIVLTAFGD
jgi:CheY-like chemotaxis protein